MTENSKKTLKITLDDKLSLAIKRKEAGDLVGALNILYSLIDSGYKSNAPYSLIAKIYYEMELYNYSVEFWFKFLSRTNSTRLKLEAYSALSACFCEIGDTKTMGYYADLKFSLNDQKEQEYDHVILDYFDYVYDCVGEKYHIVYPDSAIKPKRLLFEADALSEVHAYDESNEILQKVTFDKEEYVDAQLKIFLNLVTQDKLLEAKDVIENLYKFKRDNPLSVVYLVMFYHHYRDKFFVDNEVIATLLDECLEKDFDNSDTFFRVALMLAQENRLDDSLKMIEKSLRLNEYEINGVFLKALIFLNGKNYEKAHSLFTWLHQITKSPIVERYRNLCEQKAQFEKPFGYDFRLSKEDEEKYLVKLGIILTQRKNVLKIFSKEEIKSICGWALLYHDELESEIIDALFSLPTAYFRNYLIELLVSYVLSGKGKLKVIENLVLKGYNKMAGASFDNIFVKLKFAKATFEKENGKLFLSAYAKAFARTSAFNKNAVDLREAAFKIYYMLKDNGNLSKIKDEFALACAITIESGFKMHDKKLYDILFKTTKKKVDAIFSLMGNDDGNS